MGEVVTSPSSRSASITFWAVVVATPYSWLIVRIDGSLDPFGKFPDSILPR